MSKPTITTIRYNRWCSQQVIKLHQDQIHQTYSPPTRNLLIVSIEDDSCSVFLKKTLPSWTVSRPRRQTFKVVSLKKTIKKRYQKCSIFVSYLMFSTLQPVVVKEIPPRQFFHHTQPNLMMAVLSVSGPSHFIIIHKFLLYNSGIKWVQNPWLLKAKTPMVIIYLVRLWQKILQLIMLECLIDHQSLTQLRARIIWLIERLTD